MAAARAGALDTVDISGAVDTGEAADGDPALAWQRGAGVAAVLAGLGVPQSSIWIRSIGTSELRVMPAKSVHEPQNRYAAIRIVARGRVISAFDTPDD